MSIAVVPRTFRDLVLRCYPGLKNQHSYFRLMSRLMFSPRLCEASGEVMIDAESLAEDADRKSAVKTNNFHAAGFLADFRHDVFSDRGLSWSRWNRRQGRCRTAKVTFVPEVEAALETLADNHGWLTTKDAVDFVTGRPIGRLSRSRELQQRRADAVGRLPNAECNEATQIIEYLNAQPPHAFKRIGDNAIRLLLSWKTNPVLKKLHDKSQHGKKKNKEFQTQLHVLRSVYFQPTPVYQPSPAGRTARVFPLGEGILSLKKELRKEVCVGWHDADLKSAQLAILGKLWEIEPIQVFLLSGRSFWAEILDWLAVPAGTDQWTKAKEVCKEVLYSLAFGMGLPGLRGKLTKGLRPLGIARPYRFLEHPLIAVLFQRREEKINELISAGLAYTCFGKKIVVTTKEDARSALAQQAQAVELRIVHAAYELAATTDDFRIVLHQHDGFTVAFRRRADDWKERINEKVRERADSLGIHTFLEWTSLGTHPKAKSAEPAKPEPMPPDAVVAA